MELPALVVRVPNQIELASWSGEARRFANAIGAEFVDGGRAFEDLAEDEFDAHWLPYDGHWNQRGSDRFAAFILEVLVRWP